MDDGCIITINIIYMSFNLKFKIPNLPHQPSEILNTSLTYVHMWTECEIHFSFLLFNNVPKIRLIFY